MLTTYAPIFALTGTLLGAIIGVVGKWLFDARMARQRNAFDLHKELHSSEMREARSNAWAFVRGRGDEFPSDIRATDVHGGESLPFWTVMQFFHRLAKAWAGGFVPSALVFELFGELLVWWQLIVFAKLEPIERWPAGEAIGGLYGWMTDEVDRNPSIRPSWEMWHQLARDDAKAAGVKVATIIDDRTLPKSR